MTINHPTVPHFRLSVLRAFAALCLGLLSLSFGAAAHAEDAPKKSFDIPAGEAFTALKQFLRQSGEQLIYKVDSLEGVKTNAIKGDFTPRDALDRMFAG